MNEVQELSKITGDKLPSTKGIHLDDLHKKALKHFYLELGAGQILYLLSPSYAVINPTPNEEVSDFIKSKENTLDSIKEYIMKNLMMYSVLLDVNSYFVDQNSDMVLARLRERDSDGRLYEIKFYTHSPRELITHYKDKIYIGRDFIDLHNFKRKHFGLNDFIDSLRDQYDILLDKAEVKLKKPLKYKSFFQEIKESLNELHSESMLILQPLPKYIDLQKISSQDLIEINSQYRTINHFLIELNDEVGEFENLLRFRQEIDFARYVTKYKKDLSNLISLFNIKINGYLSGKIRNHKHS
ncbi:hypothetical protein ACFLT9_02850 [Acidobacteriota bacterium]